MLQWILPLVLIFSGFLVGLIFNKLILARLAKIAYRTRLPGNEIIFQSLRSIPLIWFVVLGFYGAIFSLQQQNLISGSIASVLQKIVTIILLYSVTLLVARIVAGFVTLFGQKVEGLSASLLSNLARIIVFMFGGLVILDTLGISITPILTTLGIGGLAVALAFQDTLSNLFSGLYIIISRQVRAGDYVKLQTGEEGYVADISWRNTTIREITNNLVVIPNSKLGSAIFTNYHLPAKDLRVPIQVSVSYDSDLDKVERVTVEVAREVMQEITDDRCDFEPFVRYHAFGDFSIQLTVFLSVNEFFEQRMAKHEFIKRLHRRYQQEGIKIPFPSRDIYVKQKGEEI